MANDSLPAARSSRQRIRFAPRTLVVAVVLLAAGVLARKVWDGLHDELIKSPRYQITTDVIQVTPAEYPPWIRADVKAQVLRDSGITQSLTLLDQPGVIQHRLVDAFELHPWVQKVQRVALASPNSIEVDLVYREPVAVVEVSTAGNWEMLPVDQEAVRLPDGELLDVEKAYLPRITSIDNRPLVGEAWDDERMRGAAELAARLRGVWEAYSLHDIVPSAYPEVQRSHRFYTYEIRASGGTAIRWGAAPGFGPPGESAFDEKLSRLASYIQQNGRLDSIDSPQAIDLRDSMQIEKRAQLPEHSERLR